MLKPQNLKHACKSEEELTHTCMQVMLAGAGEVMQRKRCAWFLVGWLCRRKNQPRRGSLQVGKISKVKTKRAVVFDPPIPIPLTG